MNDVTKHHITELLRVRLKDMGTGKRSLSQRDFGEKHKISNATLSNVLSIKWDLIADRMWRKLSAAVGYTAVEWKLADTRDLVLLKDYATRCKEEAITMGLHFRPGSGKTAALRHYAQSHSEVVYLECAAHWTKRYFMQLIYRGLGRDPGALSTSELGANILEELRSRGYPLIILDEVDKLTNSVLLYLVHLYNQLDGICGFFYAGSDHLELKMERGCTHNKAGYRELYSRMGGKWTVLNGCNKKDITAICFANGIKEPELVQAIWNEYVDTQDIRRVKRMAMNHLVPERKAKQAQETEQLQLV